MTTYFYYQVYNSKNSQQKLNTQNKPLYPEDFGFKRNPKIQFSLTESPFHAKYLELIKNTKDISKIREELEQIEIKNHWDNWDITLEAIQFWTDAYKLSDNLDWRLWLAPKVLDEIINDDGKYYTWELISHRKLLQLYKTELLTIDWPSPISHLKDYLFESKKAYKLKDSTIPGLDDWAWYLYRPEVKMSQKVFKELSKSFPEFDNEDAISIINNNIPQVTNKELFIASIDMFRSHSENRGSIDKYPLTELINSNIPEINKLTAYLGYLSSAVDHELNDIITLAEHSKLIKLVPMYKDMVLTWMNRMDEEALELILTTLGADSVAGSKKELKNSLGIFLFSEVINMLKEQKIDLFIDINNFEEVLKSLEYQTYIKSEDKSLEPLPTIT